MKIGVRILPRPVILDTQGRAVEKLLAEHGRPVRSCRIGRYVEMELEGDDQQKVFEQVQDIAEFVLYNPLTENFELERIDK